MTPPSSRDLADGELLADTVHERLRAAILSQQEGLAAPLRRSD